MGAVGTVVNVTRQGFLLVRARSSDAPPRIGATLTDARRNPVGRIIDVIGPVRGPYAVVAPQGSPTALLGKELHSK
ncbi:MAG TPA: Gar1/Naf1 family protein [Candidatus Thermoplasmatota archaeon]|nr:Gar1/Naf1 family protein [Candidatus Thermoplasmatota archaeon]